MIVKRFIISSIIFTLVVGAQRLWASTAEATSDVPLVAPIDTDSKKLRAAQKAEAAKKEREEKKAAAAEKAKANISPIERAQKALERAKANKDSTYSNTLSSEQEKTVAEKELLIAENFLELEKIKKEGLDLENSSTAKEEDKKAVAAKVTVAENNLVAAKAALEEAKAPKKTPEKVEVAKPPMETKEEQKPAESSSEAPKKIPENVEVAKPPMETKEEQKPVESSSEEPKEENIKEMGGKKKPRETRDSLASKEEIYVKAKEAVEKIVTEARKNPELKKKLEEVALKLKEVQKQQQDAQDTLDVAIKSYHKAKDDSKAGEDELKATEEGRGAALNSLKTINEELAKHRELYETLFAQTENTKQLRMREYKRVEPLRPIRARELKTAETALSGLEMQMDKLLSDTKAKDKDITALEQKIEEARRLVDKMEEELKQTIRKVVLTKLRAETVVERCARERDRAQERLTALQEHAKSKKGKKTSNSQDFKDEIDLLQSRLLEKETALQAAQKSKGSQDLDVAAVGFNPEDPLDAEILKEEMTTPEERLLAKKDFHKILQNYKMARKVVVDAEKDLIQQEKQYVDVKGQKRPKDKDIKTVTRTLKKLQFALIRAIRAELKAKKAYEIALKHTETLRQTRLRVLRELEALVKYLEQRFAEAKKALIEAEGALSKSQNAKPVDKKGVALSTEEVDFAKTRLVRIKRDKDQAYKALKVAREKAAIYMSTEEKKARKIFKTSRAMEEDQYDEQEWDDEEEEQPLVYRDEDEEELQEEAVLESEGATLEGAEEETDGAGKMINEEVALEKAQAQNYPVAPQLVQTGVAGDSQAFSEDLSDGQDAPISETVRDSFDAPPVDQGAGDDKAPRDSFDAPPVDQRGGDDKAPRGSFDAPPVDQGDGDDQAPQDNRRGKELAPSDKEYVAAEDPAEDGSQYLIPGGNPDTEEPLRPEGEEKPGEVSEMPSFDEDEAERKRVQDAADEKRRADEEAEQQRLADEEEARKKAEEEDKQTLDTLPPSDGEDVGDGVGDVTAEDVTNPLSKPDGEDPSTEAADRAAVAEASDANAAARQALAQAEESGNRSRIINEQIAKEKSDTKLAQAQIKQSPYGREIKPKEQNSWENSYGRDLFDPEAPDKGGVFNAKPINSENVTDLVMDGSSLTKPENLVERGRVSVTERPGTSASVKSSVNEALPSFGSDTGIQAL